ncbi:hypothetical protein TWF481_001719 [Arthrobotrys musiformis]|uniref:Ribosomal protein S7 domain-containing protein n=1 Tax=Arthrobotrys musiformis TaxID=47236 RepID=A0AAV9VWH4_9PEZI
MGRRKAKKGHIVAANGTFGTERAPTSFSWLVTADITLDEKGMLAETIFRNVSLRSALKTKTVRELVPDNWGIRSLETILRLISQGGLEGRLSPTTGRAYPTRSAREAARTLAVEMPVD